MVAVVTGPPTKSSLRKITSSSLEEGMFAVVKVLVILALASTSS
jgi:hypothetical protein